VGIGQSSCFARLFSQGESVEEAFKNIKEAIESHLIALKAEGKQPPKDQTMVFSHVEI
jgi:predicted RNase H-like HicB family nuclease